MRAMVFFAAIALIVIWAYLGIHYGKTFGKKINKALDELFH